MKRDVLLIGLAAFAAACNGPATPADDKIRAAVSVPPQAWLVDRIGGERVEVEVMLPPGSAPATYEPSPRQRLAFDRARLLVEVGHPDFPFEKRHLEKWLAGRSGLEVVDMAEGVDFLPSKEEDGHPHPEGETDPHLWLSPPVMESAARRVEAALSRIDPGHAELYSARLAALLSDVQALDRDLAATFAGLERRRFLVQHPAWGYFAAHYGLEQTAIESGGKEPGAASLVALAERARRDGVRVIFTQRGISDRGARAIAREIGARMVEVDPLAYDWLDNLRRVAAALREALDDRGGAG